MILSNAHRFIFIKGLKVGGTSVEIALSSFCGPEDIITPITPIDELKRVTINGGARNYSGNSTAEVAYLENLCRRAVSDLPKIEPPPLVYYNHMPLREVLRLQGPAVFDYCVVCIERNPYAKIFSWANHMLSFDSYQSGGEMLSQRHELKRYVDEAIDNRSIVAVKNIDRYRGSDGVISAHVMRFEHLTEDFRKFSLTLGIDCRLDLPHVKKGILANNLDPRQLLDRQQITVINELFSEEFKIFHYEPL
jgi:hypothetical protein